jgi:hypothetical protein
MRPPGSRWLNRLFCLGCLASLLPLYYEYHYTHNMAQPQLPKDDPWVRVIDAAGPPGGTDGKVSTTWRHHPRHRARVSSQGSVLEEADVDDDAAGPAEGEEPLRQPADEAYGSLAGATAAAARLANGGQTPLSLTANATLAAAPAGLAASAATDTPLPASVSPTASGGGKLQAATESTAGARRRPPSNSTPSVQASLDAASTARATGAAASLQEDEVSSYLRGVDAAADRAKAGSRAQAATPANRTRSNASTVPGGSAVAASGKGSHPMWRVIPGGVRDVVEQQPGGASRTWSVEGTLRPRFESADFISDAGGRLSPRARWELNGNLTNLARSSPCRLAVFVTDALPADPAARRAYGANLLRSWLKLSRAFDVTSLLMLCPQAAEVLVSPRCSAILHESNARQLSLKATEILWLPPLNQAGTRQAAAEYGWEDPRYSRLDECALKASFYISFILRSRGEARPASARHRGP